MNRHSTACSVIVVKVKVKWSRYRPGVAQWMGRGIALLFHDRGTRCVEWSAARSGRTLPPGNTRYRFYRRLGRPQGRSGRAENLVPTGFRSKAIQPEASLYTEGSRRRFPKNFSMFKEERRERKSQIMSALNSLFYLIKCFGSNIFKYENWLIASCWWRFKSSSALRHIDAQ